MSTVLNAVEIDGISLVELSQYPSELGDSWIHASFINGSVINLSISMYKDNTYPKGAIIVSEFVSNKYPDMYTLQKIEGASFVSDRMYTNPIYRRQGYWKYLAGLLRSVFYTNFNLVIEGSINRSQVADKFYKNISKVLKHNSPNSPIMSGRFFMNEQEPPRDPTSPVIWYEQRIGGIND
jgi:hypothetical protein